MMIFWLQNLTILFKHHFDFLLTPVCSLEIAASFHSIVSSDCALHNVINYIVNNFNFIKIIEEISTIATIFLWTISRCRILQYEILGKRRVGSSRRLPRFSLAFLHDSRSLAWFTLDFWRVRVNNKKRRQQENFCKEIRELSFSLSLCLSFLFSPRGPRL